MSPRSKLVGVHPTLVDAYDRLSYALSELGHPIIITDGARSTAEQQALYAKGRSKKGEPPYTVKKPLGRTVTNADGVKARSNHQITADGYGHAIDCAFLHDGKPCWGDRAHDHPWQLYGEAAKALGLEWGGDWKDPVDRPHIQLPKDLGRVRIPLRNARDLTDVANPSTSVGPDVPGGGAR